jgi:hypothetical protein
VKVSVIDHLELLTRDSADPASPTDEMCAQ